MSVQILLLVALAVWLLSFFLSFLFVVWVENEDEHEWLLGNVPGRIVACILVTPVIASIMAFSAGALLAYFILHTVRFHDFNEWRANREELYHQWAEGAEFFSKMVPTMIKKGDWY